MLTMYVLTILLASFWILSPLGLLFPLAPLPSLSVARFLPPLPSHTNFKFFLLVLKVLSSEMDQAESRLIG